MAREKLLSLPEAAMACRLTWPQAYAALTAGRFGPPERRRGRWYVSAEGVKRYVHEQAEGGDASSQATSMEHMTRTPVPAA
jgi:hypothetical protein